MEFGADIEELDTQAQRQVEPPDSAAKGPVRVLLTEDDALLRDHVLVPQLTGFGFDVVAVDCALAMERQMEQRQPDILVLDVGLPDADGFDLARTVRAKLAHVGIVMLTGRNTTADKVRGLTEGADAYLSKPIDVELLAATLYSLARRLRNRQPAAKGEWRLDADGWCLLSPSSAVVALTRTESKLLALLLASPNRAVSRDVIIATLATNVYDFDPHRLDSLVHRLRKKVQRVLGAPMPLNSVHGEGYVFVNR